MTTPLRLPPIAVVAALAFAACADPVVTPLALDEDEANLPEISLEQSPSDPERPQTTIERLFESALDRVAATHGEAIAAELRAEMEDLRDRAREAFESGDLTTGQLIVQQADLRSARLIVGTYGPRIAERAIRVAGEGVRRLRAIIAERRLAGENVSLLQRVVSSAAAYRDAARRVADRGQPAEALMLAARAVDLARFGLHQR